MTGVFEFQQNAHDIPSLQDVTTGQMVQYILHFAACIAAFILVSQIQASQMNQVSEHAGLEQVSRQEVTS